MKRVVSVSLGSSRRNHRVEVEILGQQFSIERVGTDGDLQRAVQMIRSLDGEVDAIGLGGVDLYLVAGKRRYMLRDASMMARAASVT
ncbi:MAG: quinate 5-dehydrogenase, partial [Bacillota bacterium]